MRLFFYIALILTISSCGIFKGTVEPDPIVVVDYDLDGVPDFTDEDTIDIITEPNIVMSNLVSYDVPDQFIHSLDEIENKERLELIQQIIDSAESNSDEDAFNDFGKDVYKKVMKYADKD